MVTSARKVGVFGGMFDPPHIGHVIVAREAAWQLGLDEVRLVVCARPAHRGEGHAPAQVRFALVEAAVAGHSMLVASRAEIERPGPSYMVDTLQGFASDSAEEELWLIVGADQLLGLPRWREPARIAKLARLAVVARDSADLEAVSEAAEAIAPGRVDLVSMPAVGLSSTVIRDRISRSEPVDHLLPPGVSTLIDAHGLYRAA